MAVLEVLVVCVVSVVRVPMGGVRCTVVPRGVRRGVMRSVFGACGVLSFGFAFVAFGSASCVWRGCCLLARLA